MISLDYINGSIDLETERNYTSFKSYMESCKQDIDNMFSTFSVLEDRMMTESFIMGDLSQKSKIMYESEHKNVFKIIGEKIIDIFNKFSEFIDTLIDKIKTASFQKKSDLQKLDILLKNHPELKNEAICAFNKGALDLSDVKSLKELDKTFDEILRLSKQKDVDPKTLKGKWEKAKQKFSEDEKSWTVVKVASATTIIITAALALKTFTSKCTHATNEMQDDVEKMRNRMVGYRERLMHAGVVDENTGFAEMQLQMWRELHTMHGAVRKENMTRLQRLMTGITRFVDKHVSEERKNADKDFYNRTIDRWDGK